jgi:hypothetical protein
MLRLLSRPRSVSGSPVPDIIRRVDAREVRTGDVLDLTRRVVTHTRTDGETVTLHCGPNHRILTAHDAPVRVRRHVREEHVTVDTADDGHVWYVEKGRPY